MARSYSDIATSPEEAMEVIRKGRLRKLALAIGLLVGVVLAVAIAAHYGSNTGPLPYG